MKNYLFSGLLIVLIACNANLLHAQKNAFSTVKSLDAKQDTLKVLFELHDAIIGKTYKADLVFYNRSFDFVYPERVIGTDLTPVEKNQSFELNWLIAESEIDLKQTYRPLIYINGDVAPFQYGKSSNALLSLVIPGLGDYFVADPGQMVFKPWMRTVSAFGFMGLGLWLNTSRYNEDGRTVRKFVRDIYLPGGGFYEDVWVPGDRVYQWFDGDAEIAFIAGTLIWLYDVIWVANKGYENKRFKNSKRYKPRGNGFSMKMNANEWQLGYAISL